MVDVHNDLFLGEFEAFGHRLDDAEIGLVWNDPVDGLVVEPIPFGNQGTVAAHVRHSEAIDGTPFLINIVQTVIHGEV